MSAAISLTVASGLIEMKRCPNRTDEILNNAQHILDITADYIRQAPEQWSMFHPVWPEAAKEMESLNL